MIPLGGKYWTEAEDEILRAGIAAGHTRKQVWLRLRPFGRTLPAVANRVNQLGLHRFKKAWRRWTREEDGRLTALRLGGMKLSDIATELGRTQQSVWGRMQALGIPQEVPNAYRGIGRYAKWVDILTKPHTINSARSAMGVTRGAVVTMRIKLRRLDYPVVAATRVPRTTYWGKPVKGTT